VDGTGRSRLIYSIHCRDFASGISVFIFEFKSEATVSGEGVTGVATVIRHNYCVFTTAGQRCENVLVSVGIRGVVDAAGWCFSVDSVYSCGCTSWITYLVGKMEREAAVSCEGMGTGSYDGFTTSG